MERPGIGAVHGQAGRHFDQRRVQLLRACIFRIAVRFRQQIQVQAERMRFTGEKLLNHAFSLFVSHVVEAACLPVICR